MKRIDTIIEYSSIIPGGFFVYRADETEEIIHVNKDVLNIFGCNSLDDFKKLTGNTFKGMVHKDDLEKVEGNIKKQINSDMNRLDNVEYRITRLNGEIRYVVDFGRLVNTEDGDFFIVFISDITDKYNQDMRYKKSVTNELINRIRYDSLTGLYNKDEFEKRVSALLPYSKEAYLIYFNIDRFSLYTNLFSIKEGNNLLIYISNILIDLNHNNDNMLCARLYNDIFVVFINDKLSFVETIINNIKILSKNYNKNYDINISFGVYEITDKAISVGKMINYAEMVSETIREQHEKKYAVYNESIIDKKNSDQYIINNMEFALLNKEFCIYLQPKYNIKTNEIIGAEALVRWIHNNEVISPGEFIPVFERNGFIKELDLYVWEDVCKYIRYRLDNNLRIVPISVNVSRIFFTLNDFILNVKKIVNKYSIPAHLLEFEITESLFSSSDLIKDKVNQLRELGFNVNIDDFGSAYSGLNVLKDVEFDIIKLDLKFFESTDKKAQIIIKAVIQMAKELNIPIIAEGVETLEHVNILKEYGCSFVQGYFYSKPLPINQFNELLAK